MMMQEQLENGEKEIGEVQCNKDVFHNGDIALMPATCFGKAHFGSRQQEMKLFQV